MKKHRGQGTGNGNGAAGPATDGVRALMGSKPERCRPAALLLEVIVALTIMVMALGLLAGQLINGVRVTAHTDTQTRAAQMADRMLALLELDPNVAGQLQDKSEIDGDFGEENPGWFWRVTVLPMEDVEGLGQVRLDVLLQRDPGKLDDMDTAEIVRTLVMLKAAPQGIDLATDFGVDPNQLEQISDQIPIPGFDPQNLNPQALVSMTPDQLMAILPQLLAILQQVAPGLAEQIGSGQIPNADDLGGLLPGGPGGLPGGLPQGLPGGLGLPGAGGGPAMGGLGQGRGGRRGQNQDAAGQDAGGDNGGFGGSGGGRGGRQRIEDLDRNRGGGQRRGGGNRGGGG